MAFVNDSKDAVEYKIQWYNEQVTNVKDHIVQWLNELGYTVKVESTKVTNNEQSSGRYETWQYDLIINNALPIRLIPYGIWIIGAEGRIDISGPSGVEKLVYLIKKEPSVNPEFNTGIDKEPIKQPFSKFDSVTEDNWYWLDDSSYRKVIKLSKDSLVPILESIQ